MEEAAATSSTECPAANAASTRSRRSSVGAPSRSSQSGAGTRPSAPSENSGRSSERWALPSASVNVRPIAMTSPTDRMTVDSSASEPGNFSNAQRGTLTAT